MAITTINENDYIKDSREVINNNFTELDTYKAPLNSPALTGIPTAPTPNPGDDSAKVATTEYVQEEIRTHANLPVGFEYFSPNPNIPQGSLPLFGGEYSRDTYSALWDWVQTQTGYLITESAWQALSNSQNGNVPYYSDGDGSTTFRVPSLKCWVKGANGTVSEVGSYLGAGLPNITGQFEPKNIGNNNAAAGVSGAFESSSQTVASYYPAQQNSSNVTTRQVISIDASRSSSIYGNSTTVQPPSIVGMWLVKAYGVIVDTGQIDEQQYIDDRMNAMTQYVDDEVETGVPTGCVQAFAGQTTPNGWLLCDGSAVSRTTYAKLFSVIGTAYGSGDGSTTFNLPNLIDRFVQGNATAGTVKSAGLPNIEGSVRPTIFSGAASSIDVGSGAFNTGGQTTVVKASGNIGNISYFNLNFSASRYNSIYGKSTTVQPPALTMRYIIKY